jgi:hypothetical protein
MRRALGLLRRFWARPMRIRLLLVEALIFLALASFLIRFLPFRVVVRTAEWPLKRLPPAPALRRILCKQVQWAVQVWARRVPWRALCFQQGLAVQWMLRRRHIPSVMYYGAAPRQKRGVAAHVWVCDGAVAVIGGEAAVGVAVLARFPEPAAD